VSKKPHVIADPRTEVAIAIACYAAAIWLVWDAYERRGHPRAFWAGILLP
jgi:hypothetical protein